MSTPILLILAWAIPALLLTSWTYQVYLQLTQQALGSAVGGLTALHPLCHGCLRQDGPGLRWWSLTANPSSDAVKAVFATAFMPGLNTIMLLMAVVGIVWMNCYLWLDDRRRAQAAKEANKGLRSSLAPNA